MAKVVDAAHEYDLSDPAFKWSQADQQLMDNVEKRLGDVTGCAPHAEEMPMLIMHGRRPEEDDDATKKSSKSRTPATTERFPSKLHVDVNGGLPRRFASALLYLSTPQSGGQTVFPLAIAAAAANNARASTISSSSAEQQQEQLRTAALAASRRLLKARVYHTDRSKRPEARELEALTRRAPTVNTPPIDAGYSATEDGGVAIRARAGNLLVFWTRESSGGIDARSWHAGERLASDAVDDKWLLRKFKEVPKATFDEPKALAAFVERSRRRPGGE